MPIRPSRLVLEPLERRDTPAYTSSLAGVTATMTGDAAADTLVLTVSGGNLAHNRFGDIGFASATDWNTSVAGTQTLAANAASNVTINMGGGDDTLTLGTPASPARTLLAAITLSAGGAGNDNLIVDNSGSAVADTYTYTSSLVTAGGLNFNNVAILENGELYRCGTGADNFLVQSATQNLTIEGTSGADVVIVGNAANMENVTSTVTVSNNGGLSRLTLDDSADTSGDTVTVTTAAAQTTIAGLSAGSVVYDQADVSRLTVLGGTGDDSFTYSTTDPNLTAQIRGGAGKDSFTVGVTTNNTTLDLFGDGNDDTFAVTTTPGTTFAVTVSGGSGTDLLTVTSPAGGSPAVTHTSTSLGSARLTPLGAAIGFDTVEGVAVTGTPSTVSVTLPPTANPAVVLGDDGTAADPDGVQDAGVSLVTGGTFTPTAFANPTTALTVTLGDGGDALTMTAMDAAFAPTGVTSLVGGLGADTFTILPDADSPVAVNGNAPATAPGDTLRIPTIVNDTAQAAPTGSFVGAAGTVTYQGIETLDVPVPAALDAEFAVGAGTAGGSVRFFNPDGTERFTLAPFGAAFSGGVRVASADFTGDGIADVVVGTGPGGPTRVIVFDGVTQAQLFTTDPFEAAFTGGVYVAAGDITGDGVPELVITPDEGGGPRVKVLNGVGFTVLADFLGIDDANFRGGARAAVGDIDGDGFGELVVAAGFGGGPRVSVIRGTTVGTTRALLFNDFFLFEQALRNGAFVAAGDVNGDGLADLVGGGGPGGAPRVLVLSAVDLLLGKADQSAVLANFFAGDTSSRGGIRVSTRRLDADATADLVVGAGSGAGSRVTAYLGSALSPSGTPPEALGFDAFAGFAGGVFVG